jgi:hypothetical protein
MAKSRSGRFRLADIVEPGNRVCSQVFEFHSGDAQRVHVKCSQLGEPRCHRQPVFRHYREGKVATAGSCASWT